MRNVFPYGKIAALARSVTHRIQMTIEEFLGPGTNFLIKDEAHLYMDCTVFHPRSYFEAKAKRERLE